MNKAHKPKDGSEEDSRRFHLAVRWSFLMTWGIAAGSAVTMMVLAAILGPEAYGLVALASIYVLLGQVFVDPGISQALIQRKKVTDDHLNTALVFVTCVGFALFFATALIYFLFAKEWNSEIFHIILWLSLRIPIRALTVVHIALFRRQMNLKALAIRGNISVVCGAVVGISLALLGFGYWSLVGQQLVEAIVGLALLWRLSDWRPKISWNTRSLKDIAGFSAASFMSQLGIFAYARGDAAVMGFFFGPAAVGIYRLAMRLMKICSDVGTQAVNFAALPELARNQNNRAGLRAATLRSLHIASVATLGLLGIVAATSKELVLLLGPEWEDARGPLLILCLLAAFQVVSTIGTSMLQAVGRPLLNAKLTWVWGVLAIASTLVISWLLANDSPNRQIMAVCTLHVAFGALLHFPVYAYLMRTTCDITTRDIAKTIAPTGAAAISAFVCTELIRGFVELGGLPSIVRLPIVGAAALAVFGTVLFLLDIKFRELVGLIAAKFQLQM